MLSTEIKEVQSFCADTANKYFMTRMTDKSMCVLWPDLIIHTYLEKQKIEYSAPNRA